MGYILNMYIFPSEFPTDLIVISHVGNRIVQHIIINPPQPSNINFRPCLRPAFHPSPYLPPASVDPARGPAAGGPLGLRVPLQERVGRQRRPGLDPVLGHAGAQDGLHAHRAAHQARPGACRLQLTLQIRQEQLHGRRATGG